MLLKLIFLFRFTEDEFEEGGLGATIGTLHCSVVVGELVS